MDTFSRIRIRYRRWRKMQQGSRSSTVRFAFPAVVVLSSLVGVALAVSSDASYVRIDTDPKEVEAGQEFFINIYASAHVPINAVDIKVSYPERQLDILGVDVGESIITIWTEDPYARGGYVYLRGGVFRKGFLGEHLIARVRARATESGVAKILAAETTFLAGDGKGTVVPVKDGGGEEIAVQAETVAALKSDVAIGIVTDIDGDGDVDLSDIERFLSAWHTKKTGFDFNGDGRMNFRDFAILLAYSFLK